MSYNCDLWKTKELKDFKILVANLLQHKNWNFDLRNNNDGSFTLYNMETEIHGHIKDKWLTVSSINCSGEGSGTILNMILEPAFENSTGKLVASCIWEGGDAINRITVENGKISWENIDI